MVLKGHNTLSFSIFPRFGLGSNHKSDTVDHTRDAEKRDEDWYIPYNKPYEPPRNASMAVRDNWTNRVHQEEVDHTMGETVLPHRYGGGINVNHSDPGGQGLLPANHGASLRNRARSDVTPRAVSSSSGINPNTTRSRRYPSTTQRTQAPVVTNSTTHGGIGESPSPPQRLPSPPQSSKRASFFSFGSSRKFQHPHQPPQAPPSSYPKTMPGEWPSGSPSQSAGIHAASVPITSEVDEYFDSYYSTLIPPSKTRSNGNLNLPRVDTSNLLGKRLSGRTALSDAPDSSVSSPATTYNSPTYTHAPHPYAYASSSTSLQIPRNISQPLRHTPSQIHHQQQGSGSSASNYSRTLHPTFPVSVTHNPRVPRNALDVSRHNTSALPLKASVSTPDLYSASRANVPTPRPTKKTSPPVSKGIDRWFSAETWCDAVLFPRPRFKIKTGAGTSDSGSGRIISPPSTPISGDQAPETGTRTKASLFGGRPRAASVMDGERKERRSLVKSRSAADLLSGPSVPSIPLREITRSDYFRAPAAEQNKPEEPKEAEAQDELPLPTPVPSLTQVIEDGEILQQQRKAWQDQASRSLGNKRTRSVSRARSKTVSHTQTGPRHKTEGSGTLDFLAARTLLGSQAITPTVSVTSPHSSPPRSQAHSRAHSHAHSHSRSHTHSHSNSHSHSLGTSNSQKSLKDPHHRGHSRNESWGKTALLKAGALCGVGQNDSFSSPLDQNAPPLEAALRSEETKLIRLGDPARERPSPSEEGLINIKGVSPTPSGRSGEGVGIALSSPPPSDDHSRGTYDPDNMRMPGHPYATGAVYTRYHAPPVSDGDHSHKGSDYAGPHPTTLEASFPPNTAASDVSLRHRLPPRAHLPSHPYAAASSSQADEYSPVHERQGSAGRVPSPRILRGGTPVIERDFASNAGASTSYARGTLSSMAKVNKTPGGVEGKASPTMRRTTPYQGPDAGKIPTSSKGKARDYSPLPDNYPRAVTSSPGVRRAYAASPSPPAGAESPLERRDIMPQFGHSAHNSSTQLVITALDNNDDLDHFRDLFYKPPPPNASSGSREDDASQLSKGIPSDVQSTRSTSAFTALVRSLSEELEGSRDHGKSQEGHPDDALSQEYVFLDMSRSYTSSPVPMDPGTPHRLPIHQDDVPIIQPNSAIPEDVESSRASSMLERDPGDNDTFGFPIQASPTEVVSAPPTPPRAPTHLMIQPEPDVSRQDDHLSPAGSDPRSSEVRSSYMTSASEGSRISNLSDFPVPPARPSLTPAHMSILQTYFDATPTPSKQDGDPMESMGLVRPRPPFQRRESHRTTFGGSEDMNIITEVHSAES